jgi:ribosomal protein L31
MNSFGEAALTILAFLIVIIMAAGIVWALSPSKAKRTEFAIHPPMRPFLPDHSTHDNKKSASSSAWEYSIRCPHCINCLTHNEQMTDICTSCGTSFNGGVSGASRKIIQQDRWVQQFRTKYGINYLLINGTWVKQKKEEAPSLSAHM